MTLYLWALFAGACAVTVETIFRNYSHLGFWTLECIALPFQVCIGYGVFRVFTGADAFLLGAVIFPFGTVTMRLLAQLFIFHETPSMRVYLAFSFIVMAQLVRLIPLKG